MMKPVCTCQPERPSQRLRAMNERADQRISRRIGEVAALARAKRAYDFWHRHFAPFPWKRWFAWRPVRIGGTWAWWRPVDRRLSGHVGSPVYSLSYDYRELETG